MKFARLTGHATQTANNQMQLMVLLDDGNEVIVVRQEMVALIAGMPESSNMDWQVDQYTQETIGTILAESGWELIGEGSPTSDRPLLEHSSNVYLLRKLGS